MMAVAPQRQWVRSTIESLWFIAPVALAYLFLLAISWQPDTLSLMMPGSIEEGIASGKPQFFPSLDGISQLFSRSLTAASLWLHLLSINLFAARHVFLDGIQHSLPTWHAVFLSAVIGPIGLLVHFLTKVCIMHLRGARSAE
eukprot:jgi/Tetstr1/425442/TSEL_015889.t1